MSIVRRDDKTSNCVGTCILGRYLGRDEDYSKKKTNQLPPQCKGAIGDTCTYRIESCILIECVS